MRIIFLGDISVDHEVVDHGTVTDALENVDMVLANLEGSIVPDQNLAVLQNNNRYGLHNSPAVVETLRRFHVKAVWLANNHVYDFQQPIEETNSILKNNGIASFGAGCNLDEASRPFVLQKADTTAKFYAMGWDVIGCHPIAGEHSQGVNPLTAEYAMQTLRQLRTTDQLSFVVFVMHWNYELEMYPQPAHRQLAQDLIIAGADAVIGLHGHVAQGAELFQGKPIVYGLGNWFFPARPLGNIYLQFPSIAMRELAVELVLDGRQIQDAYFHWHRFDVQQSCLSFERTEQWHGDLLCQLTPFAGMSHSEYVRWFKHHRTRRRGLPIYEDYRQIQVNKMKDAYVRLRQVMIRLLMSWHLKGGPHA